MEAQKRGEAMREIAYRKKQSLKNRRKTISIREHSDDQECSTDVRKSFVYIVTQANAMEETPSRPEIHIRKIFNTKTSEEKFAFRVKGSFFMSRDRFIFKVDFCHTLKIDILWKNKVFSPKKSVTLT